QAIFGWPSWRCGLRPCPAEGVSGRVAWWKGEDRGRGMGKARPWWGRALRLSRPLAPGGSPCSLTGREQARRRQDAAEGYPRLLAHLAYTIVGLRGAGRHDPK